MKVLKRTEQKNFRVDVNKYTPAELWELFQHGIIDRPMKDVEDEKGLSMNIYHDAMHEIYWAVYCSKCEEVKVVYNRDYGYYETVAITKTGHTINVEI